MLNVPIELVFLLENPNFLWEFLSFNKHLGLKRSVLMTQKHYRNQKFPFLSLVLYTR